MANDDSRNKHGSSCFFFFAVLLLLCERVTAPYGGPCKEQGHRKQQQEERVDCAEQQQGQEGHGAEHEQLSDLHELETTQRQTSVSARLAGREWNVGGV